MTSAYNSSDSIHQQTHYGGGHRKRRPQRSRLSRKDKFLIALIVIAVLGKFLLSFGIPGKADADFLKKVTVPEWISVQLIDVDGASRRGKNSTISSYTMWEIQALPLSRIETTSILLTPM